MPKLPFRIKQQLQTSGACFERRDKYNLHDNHLPEFWIYDADNHLVAITFTEPSSIIKGLSSGKDSSTKKRSSPQHKGSSNGGTKKKAVRKSRSKRT